MDEFVVRGGLVYDGTGAPPAQADVWVRDGEIIAVGVDAGGSDIPAVDASGCVVTPGFVDTATPRPCGTRISAGWS